MPKEPCRASRGGRSRAGAATGAVRPSALGRSRTLRASTWRCAATPSAMQRRPRARCGTRETSRARPPPLARTHVDDLRGLNGSRLGRAGTPVPCVAAQRHYCAAGIRRQQDGDGRVRWGGEPGASLKDVGGPQHQEAQEPGRQGRVPQVPSRLCPLGPAWLRTLWSRGSLPASWSRCWSACPLRS